MNNAGFTPLVVERLGIKTGGGIGRRKGGKPSVLSDVGSVGGPLCVVYSLQLINGCLTNCLSSSK